MSAADPSSVEPLFPEAGPLQEPALALLRETGALGGQLHPITRRSVADLLRAINSYHSNLIEGHDTRPRDIERALSGAFSTSPERRALQLEARAHVDVQRLVEKRLDGEPSLAITGAEFLCFIHSEFYERMPAEWRVVRDAGGGKERPVVPGRLREEEVEVGRHRPPPAAALPSFLDRFREAYDPARLKGLERVLGSSVSSSGNGSSSQTRPRGRSGSASR